MSASTKTRARTFAMSALIGTLALSGCPGTTANDAGTSEDAGHVEDAGPDLDGGGGSEDAGLDDAGAVEDAGTSDGGVEDTLPPGDYHKSSLSRDLAPSVDPADLGFQLEMNTSFTLALHQLLAAPDPSANLFYSPHSIEVALAMTWAGARNQTETDIASAMRFELDQQHLHPFFNHLDLELESRADITLEEGQEAEPFRLEIANGLWGRVGAPIEDAFLDVLALNYDAGFSLLDFAGDPAGSADAINTWIEDVTEDRIQDLIPPSAITADTRLVLVNAIYFLASWALPFDDELTTDAPFTVPGGGTVTVPMMSAPELEAAYVKADGYDVIDIPYVGNELSMTIFIPTAAPTADFDPLTALETELADGSAYLNAVDALHTGYISLKLPRFTIDGATVSLKDPLTDLGMGVAFTDAADFTGITGGDPVMVSDVLHQAFVKVDEKGTEAAAATAVIIVDTGVPTIEEDFVIDRPFFFVIRDRPTGQILFAGHLTDPS